MFFKLTLNIWKRNSIALIFRLLGLSFSLTFLVLITGYILNENSYDKHISNGSNIYRVISSIDNCQTYNAFNPYLLHQLIRNNIPEIVSSYRSLRLSEAFLRKGETWIAEDDFYCTDKDIFNILDVRVISGSLLGFEESYNIAISEKTSSKYFNGSNPIGKSIRVRKGSKELNLSIVAVYEDIPSNSTFVADILGSHSIMIELTSQDFENLTLEESIGKTPYNIYIELYGSSNSNDVEEKVNQLLDNSLIENVLSIKLQPLNNIYFYSDNILNSFLPSGSITNVRLFTLLCSIILVIAISNFIIISSFLHQYRRTEYWIRMINGAKKFDIFMLILGEVFLLIACSSILAALLSYYLFPYVNLVFDKDILAISQTPYLFIVLLFGILIIIGSITITIVSLFIFRKHGSQNIVIEKENHLPFYKFNKILIFGQISIFCSLIVILLILNNQWNYLKNSDNLGFDAENLLVIQTPQEMTNIVDFSNSLKYCPNIVNVAESFNLPLLGPYTNSIVYKNEDYTKKIQVDRLTVGNSFFKTMDIDLIAGRSFNFSSSYDIDNCIILNESAVQLLELENPIGKEVMWREVVGVVNDFKLHSMYHEVAPLLIYPKRSKSTFIIIKYIGDINVVRSFIEKKQYEVLPLSRILVYEFTSIISNTYNHENRLRRIFSIFTIIAVCLGIIGIVGLLVFSVQKRNREIRIRIIHGAKFIDIVYLFIKEFIIAILVSNALIYPLIWYYTSIWLERYEYHIQLNATYFVLGTIITLAIIFVSVIFVVFRYIIQNPINNNNS